MLISFAIIPILCYNAYAKKDERSGQQLELSDATPTADVYFLLIWDLLLQTESLGSILAIGTAIAGITAGALGVLTYRRGQTLKRQEILFPLIAEFDTSERMFLAKAVLEEFTCNSIELLIKNSETLSWLKNLIREDEQESDLQKKAFRKSNLSNTLGNRDKESCCPGKNYSFDERQVAVRTSFDALIKFCAKLEYLYKVGLLEEDELTYFFYYYHKLEENEAVQKYVESYNLALGFCFRDFELYRKTWNLPDNIRSRPTCHSDKKGVHKKLVS
jgi:hypothetical protein